VTDGIADGVGGPLCSFAKPMFKFCKELLDGVQVGRVFRQEEEPRAGRTDGAAYGIALVRAKIVHDHDVAWPQGRDENLLDIKPEAVAVDRSVDEPWRCDAIVAQRSQECHGFPVAMWHLGFDPLAARRPPSERRHVGLCPGLVDEHQAGGIDPTLIHRPLRPPTRDVGTVLLGGDQRLFL
jgi:hypothetical protein